MGASRPIESHRRLALIADLCVSRDMQFDPYIALTEALASAGLTWQRNRPDQLIVSAQEGPVWPDRGNSFWLSHIQGTWYLRTWSPVCYRVPPMCVSGGLLPPLTLIAPRIRVYGRRRASMSEMR